MVLKFRPVGYTSHGIAHLHKKKKNFDLVDPVYASMPNDIVCVSLSEMSSTSQKHKNFVSEPMGQKVVGDLAGIGAVLGSRLIDEGFDKVRSPQGS